MRTSRYCCALIASTACWLAGCTPDPGAIPAADSRITFHRGNGGEPDTLDPNRNEETSGAAILRDLYEGLVTQDVDLNIIPGTAQSWQISDDGRLYTFELAADARWSSGDPVTAQDFVAGIRRTVDPATASTYAQLLLPISNAAAVIRGEAPPQALGVRAIDDYRLEIELENATPYFLQLLAQPQTYPIHRPSLAEHGDGFARAGTLVSNGAYRLTEWVVNSHIRLEKNEHYHGKDDVQIEVVIYYNTEDRDAELRRYRAGELDYTYEIPTSQYRWIRENLPGELHVQPYLTVYFYGFDTTEPPFDDVRLRQALTMAVDRSIITEQVTGVGELPAYGIVPPGIAGYERQSYGWAQLDAEARVTEARRLYAQAGYSAANPLRVQLRFNTSENHRRLAVAVASMWKSALGAEIQIVNQEWKVMLQDRRNPALWDIMRYGWNGDYADAFTFLEIFQSDHGQNFTGLRNPRLDQLVAAAASENNAAVRSELMAEAERELLDSYAVVPVYFYVTKHLVKPYVAGYRPNALNYDRSQHYRIERSR
jgi:oligopeptide transport system substrate-binding protein